MDSNRPIDQQSDEDLADSNRGSCSGKADYGSMKDAKSVVSAIRRNTGEKLSAYQCKHCGGFHVGHSKADVVWKKTSDGKAYKKPHLGGMRQAWRGKKGQSRTKKNRIKRRRR